MKKILFLLLGIPSLVNAQAFFKIYGDTSHEQNSIHLQTPQGYYLVNHERNPLPYGETEIIRTNLTGDSLQSWFLADEFAGVFNAITPISGNRFVGCVSNYNLSASIDSIIITWYDSSFQIISSVIITDTVPINIERIIETSDGNFLIGGADDANYSPFPSRSLLMKIDSLGNVLFDSRLNPATLVFQRAMGLIETSDHYYILADEVTSGGNSASSKRIFKFDSSGNLIWDVYAPGYYAGRPNQIAEASNGYLFTENTAPNNHSGGFFRATMIDTSGAIIWSKTIYNYFGVQSIVIDHSIYTCGAVEINANPYYSDAAILKMNDQGDSLTTASYPMPKNEFAQNISTSNNMLVVSGTVNDSIYTYHGNTFLMVMDTTLNLNLSFQELKIENAGVVIFPNPTAGNFKISSNDFAMKRVEIYNMIGEIIYTENLSGTKEHTVDFNLAKGFYFVNVNDGEKNVVRKLVVE